MNLVERVLFLYFWKEELATKLGELTETQLELFKEFGWWFESISFERIEPDINDITNWERKFAVIEKNL